MRKCGAQKNLFIKKIRNRTPDGVKSFITDYIFPYSGILLVVLFVFIGNLAHAAQNTAVLDNSQMMDLDPVQIGGVVNAVSPYTPNYPADSVQVVLAMKDEDYLGKPVITETANTVIAQPTENRASTITYTVQFGDTLSSIGWNYGLKIATIKAINNLSSDTIQPGQSLKLPPADLSPSYLAQLAAQRKRVAAASTVSYAAGSSKNGYPYGWCTYYVATRRYVPSGWGNASAWLSSARSSGYATGTQPAVGAIVVTSESWMGHVAYVEAVSGGTITISEMNYRGWGIVDRRTLSANGGVVRGYIY